MAIKIQYKNQRQEKEGGSKRERWSDTKCQLNDDVMVLFSLLLFCSCRTPKIYFVRFQFGMTKRKLKKKRNEKLMKDRLKQMDGQFTNANGFSSISKQMNLNTKFRLLYVSSEKKKLEQNDLISNPTPPQDQSNKNAEEKIIAKI